MTLPHKLIKKKSQLCPAQSISALIAGMKTPVMTEIGHVMRAPLFVGMKISMMTDVGRGTRAAVLTGVGMPMVAEVGRKMRNMNA